MTELRCGDVVVSSVVFLSSQGAGCGRCALILKYMWNDTTELINHIQKIKNLARLLDLTRLLAAITEATTSNLRVNKKK